MWYVYNLYSVLQPSSTVPESVKRVPRWIFWLQTLKSVVFVWSFMALYESPVRRKCYLTHVNLTYSLNITRVLLVPFSLVPYHIEHGILVYRAQCINWTSCFIALLKAPMPKNRFFVRISESTSSQLPFSFRYSCVSIALGFCLHWRLARAILKDRAEKRYIHRFFYCTKLLFQYQNVPLYAQNQTETICASFGK